VLARRTIVIAVSAVCLIGVLASCSDADSDEPPDSGLPSKSEASSPSPSTPTSEPSPTGPTGPSAPKLPAAAKKHTKAGAIAFVRYYLDLLNYAKHTGDSQPLRSYSAEECAACQTEARGWQHLYARGGWARDGELRFEDMRGMRPTGKREVQVSIAITRAKGTSRASKGARIKTIEAQDGNLDFYLRWIDRFWRVETLESSS
jgi:Family of unknown function (DUF6318)